MLERACKVGYASSSPWQVNSHTLAKIGQTRGPCDDKSAGDLQIAARKELVAGPAVHDSR
jgi:hypothetical protein